MLAIKKQNCIVGKIDQAKAEGCRCCSGISDSEKTILIEDLA
jgi:hypothetical protein